MLNQIIEFLMNFNQEIEIKILEDNKHLIKENSFDRDVFIREIAKFNLELQGIGEREFYIKLDDTEFTIQVSNHELETELSFN